MNEKWMLDSLDEVEKKLNTNAASGLSRKAARSRRQKAGENAFFLLPRAKLVDSIREVIAQPSAVLLLLLGALLMLFDQKMQGLAVLLLTTLHMVLIVAIRFWSERISLRGVRAARPLVRVIREGQLYLLDCTDLVPGDVIELGSGDIVPCDLRLVHARELRVLTYLGAHLGESAHSRTLKNAAHVGTPQEQNDITRHLNMLYGGSVIEQGSARAIVVETGKHTYIGALQGGYVLSGKQPLPESLDRLKRMAARVQIVLLLASVPLLCLCLAFGSPIGLPLLFSTLLCLCMANLIWSMDTLLRFGVAIGMYRAAETRAHAAWIKTEHNPDEIGRFDTLLLFGKHAFSDGRLHLHELCLPDVIPQVHRREQRDESRQTALLTLAYAYGRGLAAQPSAQHGNAPDLCDTIDAYVRQNRLAVRLSEISVSDFSVIAEDTATFVLDGRHMLVSLHSGAASLPMLSHARCRDGIRRIDPAMLAQLQAFATHMEQACCTLRMLATRENGLWVLEGILAWSECFLPARETTLDRLQQAGVTPMLFLDASVANIAYAKRTRIARTNAEIAIAAQFRAEGRPITSDVGKYRVYCGFSNDQLNELLTHLRKAGKRIAILADSSREYALLRDTDVLFATTDELDASRASRQRREEHPLTSAPDDTSARRIRRRADVLIPRVDKHGGLASILHAMYTVAHARRALSDMSRYLLYTQLTRMLVVLSAVFSGIDLLRPSHILISGLFVDVLLAACLLLRTFEEDAQSLRTEHRRRTWRHIVIEALFAGTLCAVSFLFIYHNAPDDRAAASLFWALLLMQLTACLLHMDLRRTLRLPANRILLTAALVMIAVGVALGALFGGTLWAMPLVLTAPYGYLLLIAPLSVLLVAAVIRLYMYGRFH